ncbi:MAG: HAMP domain-containing histidine kinase [Sulfuriferula multivorans]|uniref:histidine kinase n=1 Tax=Sulfuriferula multivorans TaxID=1559896 RepID=A0A7C9P900_9PROT|nr:HAMP domain-containing histidine kinase [Sulfuriferula multivorans]
MSSVAASTLLSTLPARALLGRLLAVRISLIVGWAAGIAWLHWGVQIPMPLLPMGAVLSLMGLFSLSTAWRLRLDAPATQMEFLAHLLADLTAFAVLVFFSGGATNPFVSLMLVPVVIAAISLSPIWVWLLAAVAGGLYLLLLFYFQPLAISDPVAAYGMHLGGMWFNFLISAGLIAFFVTRMHAALRTRDQELAELREKQLRDERILALGTQAALAAHELATPLATIQITAHELAREFANDPDIGADCQLLEKQAQACKRILTQLAERAQDTSPISQPLNVWLQALLERWQVMRPDAQLTCQLPHAPLSFVPPDGLEQAVLNVLNNAADASPDAVEFNVHHQETSLYIDIADRGSGFTPELKAQAGRVVLSKQSEHGWGMGLALTHATLERLGGSLTLTERVGGGTQVRITLPWKQQA